MAPKETPFLTPNRIMGVLGVVVFSLIGVIWTYNNNRLTAVEEWRKTTDANRAQRSIEIRTEIALTKERLLILTDKVNELKTQVQALQTELEKKKK